LKFALINIQLEIISTKKSITTICVRTFETHCTSEWVWSKISP